MQENKIAINTIVISTEKNLILSKFTHLVGKRKISANPVLYTGM